MFQASMETKRPPMATMVKRNKAIIVKLNMVAPIMTIQTFNTKLHKASTGTMMNLAMSMKSSFKNKATTTTAMMQTVDNHMALVPIMPMDLNTMVLAPIPHMTTGNTRPSTIQGKQIPMTMSNILDTTMMKRMMEHHMDGDINMCNPIIVTANQ